MATRDGAKSILLAAAFVVLFTGVRFAAPFFVPLLVALFLAIATTPLVLALERRNVPRSLAVGVGLTVDLSLMLGLFGLLARSLGALIERFPSYEPRLREELAHLSAWLLELGFDVTLENLQQQLDPNSVVRTASSLVQSTAGIMSRVFLVAVLLAFILFEAKSFRARFRGTLGRFDDPHSSTARVRTYLLVKSATSLATGVLAGCLCWAMGLDLPLLWALLAYLLNYIPTIGSMIAALPAIALALLQLGLGSAVFILVGYLVINVVIGTILEPRFMGQALGLPPLVVLLSMLFWGFLLGPVGALFSAPLTMLSRDWLLHTRDLRWLGELMGVQRET